MTIRLGVCEKYCKEITEKPWSLQYNYDTLLVVEPRELTKELLTDYPYEYLTTKKTKLFFDYDEKSDDIAYVRTKRAEIRDRLFEHSSNFTNPFVFTESEDPKKVSFHVVFKKTNIIRANFIKEDEQELFSLLVGEKNFVHIDHQVYGVKTCFRLPYGTKGLGGFSSKEHPHIPKVRNGDKLNLSDFALSLPDDAEAKFYDSQLERVLAKERREAEEYKYVDDSENDDERKDKLQRMLFMVNVERFKEYNAWGALMVMMKTNKLSRDLFIELSEKSGYDHFDETHCIKAWRSCRENANFGMPLVIGWLKQDGVDIKKHFPTTTKSPLVEELLLHWERQGAFTDDNVANALFNNYKDNLIYTPMGWFHYTDKWTLGDKNVIFAPIMSLLSQGLLTYLDEEREKAQKRFKELKENSEVLDPTGEKAKMEVAKRKHRDKLCKDINKLQSVAFIEAVLKVAQGLYLDNKAINTFDTNAHWFCFSDNKAYDLTTKQTIDIQAKDRILTTCGYPMPERKQEDIDKMKAFLETIMPKENIPSLLSALSLFFYGKNTEEKFIVFKGEGRNGKGLLITVLKTTLGCYFYALPTEVLTEHSKGAGRASPELAQTKFSRCLMASEPDASKHIVKTTLNMLTGGDDLNVRQNYGMPMQFTPFFTMGMMCNDVPNVSGGINDAIKKRIEFQEFPYTFVETPTLEHHRKIDTSLKQKIANDVSYRNGLFYLVADAWFENKGKYVNCDASKEEQETYAKANNPLTVFLERYTHSVDTFILCNDLQKKYDAEYPKLTPQKFRTFLEQAGVKVVPNGKESRKVFLKVIPLPEPVQEPDQQRMSF